MDKTNVKYNAYLQILEEELVPAMGCTEPIAIAYGAAKARKLLGELPDQVVVEASGNIIKNVKSVIVPNTGGLKGIEAAAAAGKLPAGVSVRAGVEIPKDADRNMVVATRPNSIDLVGPSEEGYWKDEDDSFRLAIFDKERDRVKECGDSGTYPWWLRSVHSGCAASFRSVPTGGGSSPNFDYMKVDGQRYDPINSEGNSTFKIPVSAFDQPLTVIADTVAMSEPHEVEYTLTFHSDSLTKQ